MLNKIPCIKYSSISSRCMESTAFNRVPFLHAAWNPPHSIGMHFTTLHGLHCIQSQCIESTAFNRGAFYTAEWNPLHLITLHGIHCIQSGFILQGCMVECIPIECSGFHGAWLSAVYSMQRGPMPPDWMQWSLCSMAQSIPMECSGFHALWLNAV